MRIILGNGVEVEAKEPGDNADTVHLGDCEISMEDFLIAVEQVLTGFNLFEDDPRLPFVECVKSMEVIDICDLERESFLREVPFLGEKCLRASSPLPIKST